MYLELAVVLATLKYRVLLSAN